MTISFKQSENKGKISHDLSCVIKIQRRLISSFIIFHVFFCSLEVNSEYLFCSSPECRFIRKVTLRFEEDGYKNGNHWEI